MTRRLTDFDRALECVVADLSPRYFAAHLSDREIRMLLLAQSIRGTLNQACSPSFARELCRTMGLHSA